jgi:hypothetical protein
MPIASSTPLVRTPSVPSAVGLVIANLVPLVGVAFLGWDLFGIMWIYWAESGVIGAFAILRMLTAGEPIRWWTALARVVPVVFFMLHYGMFWFVHGLFVYTLFGTADGGASGESFGAILGTWDDVPKEALLALVASHGASFAFNYLGAGEWRTTDTRTEMGKPYGRVVVLHIVILASGFVLIPTEGARWALALLVVVKTALDLGIHLKAHQMRLETVEDEADGASSAESWA